MRCFCLFFCAALFAGRYDRKFEQHLHEGIDLHVRTTNSCEQRLVAVKFDAPQSAVDAHGYWHRKIEIVDILPFEQQSFAGFTYPQYRKRTTASIDIEEPAEI